MDPCSFVRNGFQRADATSNSIMECESGEAGILLMNVKGQCDQLFAPEA